MRTAPSDCFNTVNPETTRPTPALTPATPPSEPAAAAWLAACAVSSSALSFARPVVVVCGVGDMSRLINSVVSSVRTGISLLTPPGVASATKVAGLSLPVMAVCDGEDDGVVGARVGAVSGSSALADDGAAAVDVDDDAQRPLLWTTNRCFAAVAALSSCPKPQQSVALVIAVLAIVVVDVRVAAAGVVAVVGATSGRREPSPPPLSDTPHVCEKASALSPLSSSSR